MKRIAQAATVLALIAKPVFALSWTEMGNQHPFYNALTVAEQEVSHPFLEVLEKKIGRVKCTKSTLPRISPIGTSQSQTTCSIPDDLSNKESQEVFGKISVPLNDTYGAYAHFKQVGKVLMIGSDEPSEGIRFARVYTKHPCQRVANKSDAAACMDFFAVNIQPSFEDTNTSGLISVNKDALKKANEVFKIFAPWSVEKLSKKVEESQFIGMMVQHIYAGRHLNYYTVEKGRNVLPKEILNINLEDFGYAVEEIVEDMNEAEIKAFGDELVKNLFLGLPKDAFPAFAEDIIYGFDNF